MTLFPVLRDWTAEFLFAKWYMVANDFGHNRLIGEIHEHLNLIENAHAAAQELRLLEYLITFGYYEVRASQ